MDVLVGYDSSSPREEDKIHGKLTTEKVKKCFFWVYFTEMYVFMLSSEWFST